jgi:DNA mismatch repair protein MutL
VVRELVENALDAGARQVSVQLVAGGVERITVRDDGEGMAAEDALTAFARHATSKLLRAEDLASVPTLGFRGEALPSVAAVAGVRLTSRRPDDRAAAVVEADGVGARAAGVAGAPSGTTVEVRDLFAATPARRKFLRTAATEAGHVVDVLTRLAVASPRVGFRLEHDGREVLALPPVSDLGQRLAQVLGRERARGLVPIDVETPGGWALHGFVGPPRDSVGSARLVWTFVSLGAAGAGRWVRDRVLLRAVLDGYASLLMRGRYPIAVLFLRAPAGELDVNVHPAKLEVRFRDASAVHRLIAPALRARLAAALAPAASAPAETAGEGRPPYPMLRLIPGAPAPQMPAAEPLPLWTPAPRGFASLRFIGQIFDGYLLCEGDGRVVLIDQHAAHERVVFERLRAERREGGVARDALLVPEAVEMPLPEAAALAEHATALAQAGLEGEAFGEGTYLLRTVPRLLGGRDAGELLRAIASELAAQGSSEAAERAADAALATIACHSVVRVGQRLDEPQVRALLEAMDGVEIAAHCPHGRPVAAELSRSQLEALFRR